MRWALVLLATACAPAGTTYYVSPRGNDISGGRHAADAWKTLARAGEQAYGPRDRLLLARGGVWNEPLVLGPSFVGAYGEGDRPRINGGQEHAVSARGPVKRLHLSNLELTSTNDRNQGKKILGGTCGVFLNQSEPCDRLVIEDCVIHDTSGPGIYLLAHGESHPVFRNVRIERCEIYNASCGIQFWTEPFGRQDGFDGFRIAEVTVHDIGGDGIVPFGGRNGVVERCTAYRTGLGVHKEDHSPVAIWFCCNRDSVIQYCEAFDNRDGGLGKDGGGFDLDGGSIGCTLQYNYSHDNQGAGYLVCSFDPVSFPTYDNVIRFNVSVNDGLANGFAGITIWLSKNCTFSNNTVLSRTSPALKFVGPSEGHLFERNILATETGVPLVDSEADVRLHRFHDNLYWRPGSMTFKSEAAVFDTTNKYFGFLGGRGERAADPLFVDPRKPELGLKPGSPAAGLGAPAKVGRY